MDAPVLRIHLFGELNLWLGDAQLPPLGSARARALLGYLLLHRGVPQPRQRLAFVLWPDSSESQARTNLRHLLHTLLRGAPAVRRHLDVGNATLGWRSGPDCWVDVDAYEAALARADAASAASDDALAALREAVRLYRGELLPGCYDEWLVPLRDRIRRSHADVLRRLAELLGARGEPTAAVPLVHALLEHDPFDETTHRLLIRLCLARGDRGGALRAYRICADTLERELGAAPSRETRELVEALPEPREAGGAAHTRDGADSPPLVGRAREWERLAAEWRTAASGAARLVLVTGEAGIGKTRLVDELRRWSVLRGATVAEARCYGAEAAPAYGLFADWLRSPALRERLPELDAATRSELARLLPELRVTPADPHGSEPRFAPELRARLFAAVTRAVLADRGSLLLVADDVHWSDLDSVHLLHHLLHAADDAALMVVATVRREELGERHPLQDLFLRMVMHERACEIELGRLSPDGTAALAERLTGHALACEDAERLHDQTEGNPLFVVEALRAGWTGHRGSSAWRSPKVQAVIEHRLAQLSDPARELAALAAAVGREFEADVLAHAWSNTEHELVTALDELWRAGIVREHGVATYDFTHDKLREVAYLSQSPARRRHHHLAIARALERRHADGWASAGARIAGHYDRAGVVDAAVAWYESAADAAESVYASGDAARLLARALELLAAQPVTPERQARELGVLTLSLTPLASSEGFDSPRLADVHVRALALAGRLGVEPPPQLLRSLAIAALAGDDFAAAQAHGRQMRARALADADDALLVDSDYVMGIAAFWQGRLTEAKHHFEAAVARYRPERRAMHLRLYWLDPQVVCMGRLANTLWLLGEPGAASRARDQALALAEASAHPHTRAVTHVFAALLAIDMNDQARLRAHVAALGRERSERMARPTAVAADCLEACVRAIDGDAREAVARIRETLDGPGPLAHAPGMRAILARVLLAACTAAGDAHERLAAAERLLEMSGAARLWAPEAHLARAECLAAFGAARHTVALERRRAREAARRRNAHPGEQRAAAGMPRNPERRAERLRNAPPPD